MGKVLDIAAPSVQAALHVLNIGPNSILVVNTRSIDIEALLANRILCDFMMSRGMCPSIIVCVPRTDYEPLEEVIKTVSIEQLEQILAEAKAHRAKSSVVVSPNLNLPPADAS